MFLKGVYQMAKKNNSTWEGQQLSIFDEFFENMKDFGGTLSVDEINAAIESLSDALTIAKHQRRELKRKEARAKKLERQGTVSVKTEVKVRRKKGAVKQAQLMG